MWLSTSAVSDNPWRSVPGVVICPEGKIDGKKPTPVENAMIISKPNQNSGIAYRTRLTPSADWSNPEPRRQPWAIPSQMPRTIEPMVDVPIKSTVGQIRAAITDDTDAL